MVILQICPCVLYIFTNLTTLQSYIIIALIKYTSDHYDYSVYMTYIFTIGKLFEG